MKKILLVDDVVEELKILSVCLDCKEIEAEIFTATSGEEGLAIIKKEDISLLITDVHMPGMNGMELILAASSEIPNLAFIVITGYSTAEIRRDALMKGCIRFVEKPYDLEDLRCSVIEALADQKGFAGTMAGIDLSDMIQLNCLSGNNVALKVSDRGRSGMIFFADGNIVHAMVDDLEGEAAFYEIMSFDKGNIESRKNVKPPAHSINQSQLALLIEASRRRDESSQPTQGENDKVEKKVEKPESTRNSVFDELAKISGYIGAAILKSKGEVVAVDTTESNIDLNVGGPMLAKLFRMASKATADNGLEKCTATVIEAPAGTLVTHTAGSKGDLLLVILIAPGGNPTLLQMKMAHLAPKVRAN